MTNWKQPNGISAEYTTNIGVLNPDKFMTGTLFLSGNTLWRVSRGPKGAARFIRMTKKDGTLKSGEQRWVSA